MAINDNSNYPKKNITNIQQHFFSSDDGEFDFADMEIDMVDEVEPIVKKAIEENLGKVEYHSKHQLEQLSDKVHDQILKTLVNDVKKPFKYVLTVTLIQKNGAGMFATASKSWDRTIDGSCTISWQNQTIHCLINVYALAIFPAQDLDDQ